ncbi:preprotein translocase subunit YajC [Nocardioides marmoraquaticus]
MSDAAPLLFLFLALVVFWLLVMRPARNQQRKVQQVQASLEPGQEVVLSSGIFGTIRGLTEARAEVEIAPGTVVTVARQVIVRRSDELADDNAASRAPAASDAGDDAGDDARRDVADRPRTEGGTDAPGQA